MKSKLRNRILCTLRSRDKGICQGLPISYSLGEETGLKSVINHHIFQNATMFGVSVVEDQKRLPTFYWLPKLHKQPYKSRFIANSSSCTTTELSKLLTSCLLLSEIMLLNTVNKSMKGPVKIFLVNQKFMWGYK